LYNVKCRYTILDRIKYADNHYLTADKLANAPWLVLKVLYIFGSYGDNIVGLRTSNKYHIPAYNSN
jgi:hypothetical protein